MNHGNRTIITRRSRQTRRSALSLLLPLLLLAASNAGAEQIVQEGSLSGSGPPATQILALDAFDTAGGTLALNFVRLDLLTAVSGGYTTDGSGISVDILAQLDAEYSLDGVLIADTQALIQQTVPNPAGGPAIAVLLFDSDPQSITIDDPSALADWIGTGDVELEVFTQLIVSETPAGIIFFGAGGTVQYTVTYDYSEALPGDTFRRGDANGDGAFDIADAVITLDALFVGTAMLECDDASDSNDDGRSTSPMRFVRCRPCSSLARHRYRHHTRIAGWTRRPMRSNVRSRAPVRRREQRAKGQVSASRACRMTGSR